MKEINELIKKAEEFFEKEQFKKIDVLLPDILLDKYKNADLYAWKALSSNKLKKIKEAFEYAEKAIKVDPNNSAGYRQKGHAFINIEMPDHAIIELNKAIELNGNDAFAYNNRGIAWAQKKYYDKAIADYDKAIELKVDFAAAYSNRGISYYKSGEHIKAVDNYNKAIELKKNFTVAYYNRGATWNNCGEYDKAIDDFDEAIKLKNDFANAYINKGDALFSKGDFLESIANYKKAIEIDKKFFFLEDKIKLAQEKLIERKKLEESKAQKADIDEKTKIENEIEKIIQNIRDASKSEVKTVVHYTKLSVAEIYVKSVGIKMHYSNAIYMNDPMEGKVFFEYLNDKEIKQAYLNGEKRTETSVYLGSFLPAEDNDGDISHEDELVMWRTYGKDEKGNEAVGSSVVLSNDFFKSKKTENIEESISNISEEELLNVVYIKKLKTKKEISNDPKKKIRILITELKSQLQELIKLRDKNKKNKNFYKDIEDTIFKQLSTISYLFKSADYEFEHEVRVIRYMPRNSDSIKSRENNESNAPSKRFYIESCNDILPYIKRIYLGPKVEHYQQWSLYFDYEIRQRAKEIESKENPPYKIFPSDIEIIKSDCQFQ